MIRKNLVKYATYGTYIYIFLIFMMALFFNKPMMFEFDTAIQVGCLILGLGLVALTVFFGRKKSNLALSFFKIHEKKLLIIGFGLLFIMQLLFVAQFYTIHPNDAYTIYSGARQLDETLSTYFSMYPNNLLVLFFEYAVYQLTLAISADIDAYFILVLINVLAIDIAIYLVYAVTKRVFSRKAALSALLLSGLLLGFSPWLTAVYSDTLSMPVGLGIFYVYLKLKEAATTKSKLGYAIAIGALIMLGFLLKPSAVFSGIAIIVIELMLCNYKTLLQHTQKIVTLVGLTAAVAVGLLSVRLPFNYIVEHQEIIDYDETNNFPFTHWVMIGLKETEYHGNMNYGMYSSEDFETTFYGERGADRVERNIEVIVERLRTFGLRGYANYLWNKSIWIIGDGTFSWRAYGDSARQELAHGQTIRNFVYFDSDNYSYYAYAMQTIWFVILSLFVLGIFGIKKYAKKEFFIIICTIFGSILFILLFEGSPRYVLNNIGFFVIAASLGLTRLAERLTNWKTQKIT